MTRIIIDRLTSEQKKLIHSYGEKWRQIAFSTEPIDRQKATEFLKAAYRITALKAPEIFFYESPYAALKNVFVKPMIDILLSRPKRQMIGVCGQIVRRKLGPPMWKKLKVIYASRKHGGMNKITRQLGWELCYQVR